MLLQGAKWSKSCVLIGYPNRKVSPILTHVPAKIFSFGHVINHLLTKFIRSRCMNGGLLPFFLRFDGPRRKCKIRGLGNHPVILTSQLVDIKQCIKQIQYWSVSGNRRGLGRPLTLQYYYQIFTPSRQHGILCLKTDRVIVYKL